jgi:hypothetical protein
VTVTMKANRVHVFACLVHANPAATGSTQLPDPIVAAATTSLPEHLGETLDLNYRFCWLRNATYPRAPYSAIIRIAWPLAARPRSSRPTLLPLQSAC